MLGNVRPVTVRLFQVWTCFASLVLVENGYARFVHVRQG